ncbi:MAG: hypothetical protein ACX93T_04260 [Bacteroidota bacterium]
MTALQQLEQKSEQRRIQKGIQEAKLHIARNMLSGLSEEALMKLKEEVKR